MKFRDVLIIIIALVIAVFIFKVLWSLTIFVLKGIVFLIIAYIIYRSLKKLF